MKVDPHSLSMLRCPETGQCLQLISGEMINEINLKISRDLIVSRSGDKIKEPIENALLRADGQWMYPVRQGIPNLLVSDAIPAS